MSQGKHLLFVYGTLKRGEPNHEHMNKQETGAAFFVGSAETVDKFPLVVGLDYQIPFLLKLPGQGDNVQGEVYKLDDPMLDYLDKLENHPHVYLRQEVDVVIKNGSDDNPLHTPEQKTVFCYFLRQTVEKFMNLKRISDYHSALSDHPYVMKCDRPPNAKPLYDLIYD